MSLRDRLRGRQRDTRFILWALGLLLVVLTAVYYLLQTQRDLPASLVTNRVLLFVLWYIDVVLILTILVVLARHLFKLLLERRRRVLGSKFKSKLVATYIGLSLGPVLLLFLYATQLLQQSIDRWFAAPVREVLEQGSAVAEAMLRMVEGETLRAATGAAQDLADLDLADARGRPQLDDRLRRELRRQGLDYLAVYQEEDFLHGLVDPQAGLGDLPEPGRPLLARALVERQATRTLEMPGEVGRLVLGAARVPGPGSPAIVVAGRLLTPTLARQSEQLIQAYQGYRQLEVQKAELTASQLLLFLMVTLLILLAASWVGLYLARRVTVPIQALADGTRHISAGDLSYRVEVSADDELGVLVDSFNRMTAALDRGRRELTAANQSLAEERALMHAVVHNVAAGVLAIDAEGRVFLCNETALSMLRQEAHEVRGRLLAEAWADAERGKLLAVVAPGERSDGAGEAAAERRTDAPPPTRPWSGASEVRLLLGGDWRTFEVKVSRLGSGATAGEVIVLEELTELIRAQQLAAWSDAARRIAHEIKNPLTPIQLAAERMLRKYQQGGADLGRALEEGAGIIVGQVEALKSMVEEFSRFARMPRLQPVALDLGTLVEETVRLYRDLKSGVEVAVRVAPGARLAWGDPEQLRGALINLLDNAVDATDSPGRVEVSAEARDGKLELRVADSGRGIPPAAKEKLFLPHFSTKRRGTGLGLAIVHRIVSDHHGTIRVEDNVPRGAVFVVELPLPQG